MKKLINVYSIILIILAIITFEIGYCNCEFLTNILQSRNANYNFSFCRIAMYFIIILVYFILKNKIIDESIKTMESKYKKIFICATFTIMSIILITFTIMTFRDKDFYRKESLFILTSIMASLYSIFISKDNIRNLIITLLTFGIIFSFATDFNHVADEKNHFITAYNIASFNFNYLKNPLTDEKVEALPYKKLSYDKIDTFLKEKYKPTAVKQIEQSDIYSTPTGYSPILYIPSAIGITLGTMLGGSIIDIYIYGRIFNLAFYGILAYIALKILPYKKKIFYVIFLMPMLIMYAATFSVDAICVGLVSIFIAYCLKLYSTHQEIKLKQVIILAALFLLMLQAKSMAYITVSLIVLILPIKETIKKNKKYLPLFIGIIIVMLIVGIFTVQKILNVQLNTDSRGAEEANSVKQVQFILQNPLSIFTLLVNHIKDTLLNYTWISELHHHAFFTFNAKYLFLPMFLFELYVALIDDEHNFKTKEKIIFILTFLITFIAIGIPLYITYTAVGLMHISGYQARYIFPIISLILISMSSNKLKHNNSENSNLNISIASGIFIIIGLIQLIV